MPYRFHSLKREQGKGETERERTIYKWGLITRSKQEDHVILQHTHMIVEDIYAHQFFANGVVIITCRLQSRIESFVDAGSDICVWDTYGLCTSCLAMSITDKTELFQEDLRRISTWSAQVGSEVESCNRVIPVVAGSNGGNASVQQWIIHGRVYYIFIIIIIIIEMNRSGLGVPDCDR
ncbi:hypothetical protein VN97_g704 [Penicillium thymicola]|uniref:Uncharacterized protein n=1 Tax=Penicillium thymicola TaxID=293382 RepID=A0AAI9TSA5_PENTH|nr:hypothetical protein VN97_g704 [Penicillium thymicola]